ncbi:MAG: Adenylate cyclase [Labilithrix sp.]|nr:Adenylate cyclase [Labilithrix sp.]
MPAALSLVMNPGLPDEHATLLQPGTITIGRTKDNQVVCMHKSLSRKHAQLDFDGKTVRVTDLGSKNGVYVNGKRVPACTLADGDSFRCGDISFLVEGSTSQAPRLSVGAQTLPSPLGLGIESALGQRVTKVPPPAVLVEDDQRYKDRLFLMIRATELLVGEVPVDRMLEELVVLAVQVLEVDRIALLVLDEDTLQMTPRVIRTFAGASPTPYSKRVVDRVISQGAPTSFADVSRDTSLEGDASGDTAIRGAMAAPINSGGGVTGVLYADSVSRADAFRADDVALFRALANVAAVAMESAALRRAGPPNRASDPGFSYDDKTRIPL